MIRRSTHLLLALLVLFSMTPAFAAESYAAGQEPVEYIERSVDKYGHVTKRTCMTDDYILVSGHVEEFALDTGNTYVAKSYRVFTDRVSVRGEGTVDLILTDGCELQLLEGLRVSDDQTINIYAQSGGDGKLTCSARGGNAAIGGSEKENGGTVIVHGGDIKAKIDSQISGTGAGIGGGKNGNGGTFIMTGGHVEASGGDDLGLIYNAGGAGIGGGDEGNGGTVEIYGKSQLIADGGTDSAGIGGGDGGDGGKVTIKSCDYVNVNSGYHNDRHNAVGGGEGSSNDGTLNLFNTAKIGYYRETSFEDQQITDPVAKGDRENYAKTKFQVNIVSCDHSSAAVEDFTDYYHRIVCPTCYLERDPAVAGLHTSDDKGICTECGHELRDISTASLSDLKPAEYDGTQHLQSGYTLMDGEDCLKEGVDFEVSYENNINAGAAAMVVTGKGAYWNRKTAVFDIAPASITKAELMPIADQVFTGSPAEPVVLTYNGKALVKDRDYTVSYQNNIDAGTASYQVEGTGNFTDSLKGTFMIRAEEQRASDNIVDIGGGAEGKMITGPDGAETGTIAYTKAPNRKTVTVPASVAINGRTYPVVQVNAKAFKGKKIRTVIIGKNVSIIKANAFKSSKAVKVIVRTRLLTKAGVKGSLKGSGIKTVQVKVGSKKDNKKYVKKYSKIFTRKNAGRKVRVK